MKIIRKGTIFLIILLLTLSNLYPAIAKHQETAERDYVDYQLSIENFLTKTTIKGTTEPEAPVTIVIHSKKRVFKTNANENGYFEITASIPHGEHHLKIISGDKNRNETADGPDYGGWKGFRESSIEEPLLSGTTKYCRIPLTYDPFDIKLSETSGSISRNWIENQYYISKVENFKDTRKVVSKYNHGRYYFKGTDITLEDIRDPNRIPYPLSKMGPAGYSKNTLTGFFYDIYPTDGPPYDDSTYNGKPEECGTFVGACFDPDHGYRFLRRSPLGVWKEDPYTRERMYKYEVKVVQEDGVKTEPVYETEEYTRWRKTVYKVTDHIKENWENNQITITAVPKNNYENRIILQSKGDNIQTKPGDNILRPQSPVSTTLTMTPNYELHGSEHAVSINAHDSKGKLIETKKYQLDLNTNPKPPKENKKISETVSDKKTNEDGKTGNKPRKTIGVIGKLKDSDTGKLILHNPDGAKVHVKRNGFSGNAGWPTNCQYEHSKGYVFSSSQS